MQGNDDVPVLGPGVTGRSLSAQQGWEHHNPPTSENQGGVSVLRPRNQPLLQLVSICVELVVIDFRSRAGSKIVINTSGNCDHNGLEERMGSERKYMFSMLAC